MAYVPRVYRTSGGDQLVISSGGVLEFQDGGAVSFAGQAITTTGAITGNSIIATSGITASGGVVYGTAGFREYVETIYTSVVTALAPYGVSIVGTSSGGVDTIHTIYPIIGVRKRIICTWSTSTGETIVLTTGTWDGTNDEIRFTTGLTNNQWVEAIGTSTAAWRILGRSTDFTIS